MTSLPSDRDSQPEIPKPLPPTREPWIEFHGADEFGQKCTHMLIMLIPASSVEPHY